MTTRALTVRTPAALPAKVEDWAGLSRDGRKRRAAAAVQTGDRRELRSLVVAWTAMYGRHQTDTSELTMETYWRGATRLLDWCNRHALKAHRVDRDKGLRWLASMGGLNPKSRATYISGSRALLRALAWTGMGSGDGLDKLIVHDPDGRYGRRDPYTDEELRRLLAKADGRERVIVLLGADAGLRLAEIVGLSWRDVDLERRQLRIVGKGRKRATVGTTERLSTALDSYPRSGDSVLGVSRRRVQQLLDRLCRRARVKSRGVHALRHSAGTRFYRVTRDLLVVKRHLRHARVAESEIYAHLSESDYRQAVASLESAGD